MGAHSDCSRTNMVQVSANLDFGNTLRRKIHPRLPTGRISPSLRAGGSSSIPTELSNYRIRTPRPCCCWMMFVREDVMAWTGDNIGKGRGNWLGQGQNCLVHAIYGEDNRLGVTPRQ